MECHADRMVSKIRTRSAKSGVHIILPMASTRHAGTSAGLDVRDAPTRTPDVIYPAIL